MRLLKRAELLLALLEGPKYVRELQSEVGGSASTLEACIQEFMKEGLVHQEELGVWPFRKVLKLTSRGREAAERIRLEGGYFGVDSKKFTSPISIRDRGKWILALLHGVGGKIRGSTRLEKLLFLLKHEYEIRGLPYEFTPYLYGPFSSDVHEDVVGLQKAGFIEIRKEAFEPLELMSEWAIRSIYDDLIPKGRKITLTEKGRKMSGEIYNELPEDAKRALSKLSRFNEMELAELLHYVYAKYPKQSMGK